MLRTYPILDRKIRQAGLHIVAVYFQYKQSAKTLPTREDSEIGHKLLKLYAFSSVKSNWIEQI